VLRGDLVGLRARLDSDVPVLHTELHDDVETHSRASTRPWRPLAPNSATSPYRPEDTSADRACFSVVRLADDELAGEALVWGIDQHNRLAHLGLTLRPAFRGLGLGTDTVAVLCHYGFTVLGLHRLQIETLADNTAMIHAATRNGFVHEGALRQAAWVLGTFIDEVILGRLADE
jgi:RimJ/RimL family protein N-acetyltransferase